MSEDPKIGNVVTLRAQPARSLVVSSSPPKTYAVRARASGPGRAELLAGDEVISFDASWASAPSGLPGPAELLAGSFSACLLKNLERVHHLLGFAYDGAEVNVKARRQDSPPKFVEISYVLRITTNEPESRVELAHRNLQKFGTVYNTLAAVCEVHGSVIAVRPEPRSG